MRNTHTALTRTHVAMAAGEEGFRCCGTVLCSIVTGLLSIYLLGLGEMQ